MDSIEFRTILVGTDLSDGSDRLVRAASSIAELTGAALHIVHVHPVQPGTYAEWSVDPSRAEEALRQATLDLEEQVRRAIPVQFTPASQRVLPGEAPSELIRRHAEGVGADLIVIGPHAGPLSDSPFLGTTADRLVRTAGVPCLVVRGDLAFPVRRLGVLVDFSPASQAALDTATAWAVAFSGGGTARAGQHSRISVAHIAWGRRDGNAAEAEATRTRAELERAIARAQGRFAADPGIEYTPEVLPPGAAPEIVERWVRSLDIAMVVLGTRGGSRLPYEYLGGLASTVARTAPCSVLLVPPGSAATASSMSEDRAHLRRIVIAVDFHESSWEAALWTMRHFAPAADHELVHVVDLPDLPGPLRALSGGREQARLAARAGAHRRLEELRDLGNSPRSAVHLASGKPATEIVRLAAEVNADLVVVGEEGIHRGLEALLGSTAERILFESAIPVLLARKVGDGPPRRLLLALDSSEVADRVLDWAATLLDRFAASATVLNVVDRLLLADELVGMPSADALRRMETEAIGAMQGWLDEKVGAAGLPTDRVRTRVGLGDPGYEIIDTARRDGTDLLLIGSRGDDIAPTPLIGRIVNKVVRSAPCSVLVVAPGQVPEGPADQMPQSQGFR